LQLRALTRKTKARFFDDVRSLAIQAVFSDEAFFDRVVLKGGNALALAYDISSRTSLDLDFSIEADFPDPADAAYRLERACVRKFLAAGLVVLDFKFAARPTVPRRGMETWGGYQAEFKIAEAGSYAGHEGDVDQLRKLSLVVGPEEMRKVRIDLSKFEYTIGKLRRDFNDQTIYVYSPMMIAIEKLRAICQQMPQYEMRRNPAARARDFFDIQTLVEKGGVFLASGLARDLGRNIFDAKSVPLALLRKVPETREFHRPDWDSVRFSSSEAMPGFDFYFDFVCKEIDLLKSPWNI
jgi:hypothetical protein